MPHDKWGQPIQALSLSGSRAQASITSSSSRVALPAGFVFRVSATADCYILFGNSGVTATADASSDLFPAGVEILVLPAGATHIACIQATTAGVLQITTLV